MMHGRASEPQGGRQGQDGRWRLMLALFVMLAAVVPHLTLSASPPGAPVVRMAHGMPVAVQADGTVPCHEQSSRPSHASTLPACCIIGCAVIAETPALALPVRGVAWMQPKPPQARMLAGISREPAKPPPRLKAAFL
ncbi:hypothetical protein [Bosea sp. (in: a-proteobacteria)]|uniref:hypothetical protein n=1 Tax=Bosea sp. (in: a-proteobacteria) TaxID=1871050 RepID=UPI0011FD7B78|nr:hypothetical protein [Bosea sp. (in: a-proteobacteria)]TAJ31785.1 MAG: hypothetical protein EPO59_06935 [Bosea sp. (in: a-proteobacteria)]